MLGMHLKLKKTCWIWDTKVSKWSNCSEFCLSFHFLAALPEWSDPNVWVTPSPANLPGFSSPPPLSFAPLRLFAATVGNEPGNDQRKSWIPFSVSKSLLGLFWTRERPRPGLSSNFKDAGDCVLHQGSGDHWRAPYMSGNREECPLISDLQREAFK